MYEAHLLQLWRFLHISRASRMQQPLCPSSGRTRWPKPSLLLRMSSACNHLHCSSPIPRCGIILDNKQKNSQLQGQKYLGENVFQTPVFPHYCDKEFHREMVHFNHLKSNNGNRMQWEYQYFHTVFQNRFDTVVSI